MKHIIFGGNGFVGRYTARDLLAAGEQVLICDIAKDASLPIYEKALHAEGRALAALGLAIAISVPLGIVAARSPGLERPLLGTAAFCGGCHQFNFPEHRSNGRLAFTSEPMQDTLEEWRRHGGDQTCQGCHMARGGHRFLGGYNRQTLGEAVAVTPRLSVMLMPPKAKVVVVPLEVTVGVIGDAWVGSAVESKT